MSNTSHATLDPGIIAFPSSRNSKVVDTGPLRHRYTKLCLPLAPVPHAARDHVSKSLCDGHGTSQESKDEPVETTCPWPSLVFLQEFFVERHAHQRSRFLNEDEVAPETQRDHEFMASRLLPG